MKANGAPLDCTEWDFERLLGGVPDKEIKVCYHYEFTREVPSIREGISAIRNELRRFLSILDIDPLNETLSNVIPQEPAILIPLEYPQLFFIDYPEWPETPYLKVNSETREKRLKTLLPDETSGEALAKRLEAPEGIKNPNIWPEIKLTIPAYYTHQELIDAFRAYLKVHFPKQGKTGRNCQGEGMANRRRGGPGEIQQQRKALIALGIYRLCKKNKTLAVSKFLEGKNENRSESSLNRTKKLAKKHLAKFGNLAAINTAADTFPEIFRPGIGD